MLRFYVVMLCITIDTITRCGKCEDVKCDSVTRETVTCVRCEGVKREV